MEETQIPPPQSKGLSDTQKAWIRIILVVAFIAILFYAGILVGADSTCKKSGGTLMSGLVCVDIDHTDYCKGKDGNIYSTELT